MGNAAAKFIDELQIQQNYIIRIMTGSSFFQTKLFPIYCELNLLKLSNIYKLEVLKFVYKFRVKLLPSSFADYFHSAPEIHNKPTRFSKSNNLVLPTFYTSAAQRFIRYQGCKIWNELPAEIKNKNRINCKTFLKHLRMHLHNNQK